MKSIEELFETPVMEQYYNSYCFCPGCIKEGYTTGATDKDIFKVLIMRLGIDFEEY